jgi:chromosomal replication initiation ATPase DnaA
MRDYISLSQPATLVTVARMAREINSLVKVKISKIETIAMNVYKHYDVNISWLNSKSRKRMYLKPKQVSIYMAKQFTKEPLRIIGEQLGGCDHSTVLSTIKLINNLIETDKEFSKEIKEIEHKLKYIYYEKRLISMSV